MSAVKVSVAIPIYNVEAYLRECLDSVVNQTLREIEIICINDGSTDKSLEIIREYAARDPRVVVIDKPNSGYGHSMNMGFDAASGEYIGIVESDDFAEPDMFETLYRTAKKNSAEVVKSNYFEYYTKPDKKNVFAEYFTKDECGKVVTPRNHKNGDLYFRKPTIWTAIYQTAFLRKNGIRFTETPGASFQDTAFTFKIWSKAERAVFVHKAFLHYRQDNMNSSVNSKGKVYCVCDEYHEIDRFLEANGPLKGQLESLKNKAKYDTYIWNYERLGDKFRYEFLETIAPEFRSAREKGAVNSDHFEWWKWRGFNMIADNPMAYHVFRTVERYDEDRTRVVFPPATLPLTDLDALIRERKAVPGKVPVSVIIPVYNVEKYIKACLESVVNQTLSDIEIICVNDGSTDHSLSVLEEYAKSDSRMVVVNKNNGGLSSARNAGLAVARGEYLVFLDSDDYLEADACRALYEKTEDTKKPDVIVFGTNIFPGDSYQDNPDLRHWYEQTLYTTDYELNGVTPKEFLNNPHLKPFAWRNCVRRAYLEDKGITFPEQVRYGEDIVYQFQLFPSAGRVLCISERLYNYRIIREGSLMSAVNADNKGKVAQHVELAGTVVVDWERRGLLAQAPGELLAWLVGFVGRDIVRLPSDWKAKLSVKMATLWKGTGLTAYIDGLEPWEQEIAKEILAEDKPPLKLFAGQVTARLRRAMKQLFPAPAESFHDRLDQVGNLLEQQRFLFEQQRQVIEQLRGRNEELARELHSRLNVVESAVRQGNAKHTPLRGGASYDVGLAGHWYSTNYGSMLSYFALHQILVSMGLSVLMIEKPELNPHDLDYANTHTRRFAQEHYRISARRPLNRQHELNWQCDAFVVGADQPWNYAMSSPLGHFNFLDFGWDERKKVAYGASFGNTAYYGTEAYRRPAARHLRRMKVSVSGQSAAHICGADFGVQAAKVLDPLLACEPSVLLELFRGSRLPAQKGYVASYLLDPSVKKASLLQAVAREQGKSLLHVLDGDSQRFAENKARLGLDNVVDAACVQDLLHVLFHSECIVTDCYYGVCLAILFQKPFLAFENRFRGDARLPELLALFGLEDRLVPEDRPPERQGALAPRARMREEALFDRRQGAGLKARLNPRGRLRSRPRTVDLGRVKYLERKQAERLRRGNERTTTYWVGRIGEAPDYTAVQEILYKNREHSRLWLKNALFEM